MKRFLFLPAMTLLAAPLPAAEPLTDKQVAETRRMLDSYGACVVKRHEAAAAEAIAANVDNADLIRKYRLIDGSCLPRRINSAIKVSFQGDQYRYALADALVRRNLASLPAPVLDAVPRLDHRDPGAPPSRTTPKGKRLSDRQYRDALKDYEQNQAFTYLSRYGECVVRVDPAAARDLLLTEPVTALESARFAALRTPLGTCLPENAKLSFGKLALRGTIAINYYRLARAAGLGRASR